jgi:hypothetical protein
LKEICTDPKQKIFLITARDSITSDNQDILILPKRMPSKKHRVATTVSIDSQYDPPGLLKSLLLKMGSVHDHPNLQDNHTMTTAHPEIMGLGARYETEEMSIQINSHRGSFASSSSPSPLSNSKSNTQKYSSRENVGVLRVSRGDGEFRRAFSAPFESINPHQ